MSKRVTGEALTALFQRAKKFHAVLAKATIISVPAGWYKINVVLSPDDAGVYTDALYLEPYDRDTEDDEEGECSMSQGIFCWSEFISQYDAAKGEIKILGVQELKVEE